MKKLTALIITAMILLTSCGENPQTFEIVEEPIITTTTPPPVEVIIEPEQEVEAEVVLFEYRNIEGNSLRNSGLEIRNYLSEDPHVVIPSEINGIPVTGIDDRAFRETDIISVIIPESLTSIDRRAFHGRESLTSVILPDNLIRIRYAAFKGCISLANINIPDNVIEIDESAFSGCAALENIILPSGLTSIASRVFLNCTSLKSVYIPESVTKIEGEAFKNCTSLTEINLPSNLTSIGWSAFAGCTSLTNLYLPDSIKEIDLDAFKGSENIIVSFKGETYTYENINKLFHRLLYGCYNITKWNETGEWDVSELALVIDISSKASQHAFIVSLDGAVKRVEFSWEEAPRGGDYQNWRKGLIMDSLNDSNYPIEARFDRIPNNIIESIRTLEPFVLDYYLGTNPDGGSIRHYVAVGLGEEKRLIQIGAAQHNYFYLKSFDNEKVNELAVNMWDWYSEQWQKTSPQLDESYYIWYTE
ncbi:MAG: leucine-rich repeat domain-containing protein [Oscillospiraceae bacterium]|nr:leucine-rich repeat domain-containing protein [Oscillospiraceae bacterium]